MNLLVLAPHPFYKERGTPIALYQLLRVLGERKELKIDVLTYHEGNKIDLPENISLHRIKAPKFISDLKPGFSIKKIVCDILFFVTSLMLIIENNYMCIHAVEESVFFAMLFKSIFHIPYVYDLDSSLAQQIIEGKPFLKVFRRLFNFMEKKAIRGSVINLPVCNALADLCEKNGSAKTVTVPDISLLDKPDQKSTGFLKRQLGIENDILLYVGNLEVYQGIDLLLESFKLVCSENYRLDLVIVGGTEKQINYYRKKAVLFNIQDRTHFLGPKPFNQLHSYLAEADIIASPRIRGINTPMKIYPFLHSGKPVIATNLYTHTQMLTDNEAYLAPPNPAGFAKGILTLASNKTLRDYLGENGKALIEKHYTFNAHRNRIHRIYDWLENEGLSDSHSRAMNNEIKFSERV